MGPDPKHWTGPGGGSQRKASNYAHVHMRAVHFNLRNRNEVKLIEQIKKDESTKQRRKY